MKILRMFDSLKFVRAMFVAVVATLILNVAHAATLPAGYTELEYLESTGTQYIDTGVNIGENIQTKVKFGKTTNSFSRFGFVIGGGIHYQGLVTRTSENSYYMSMYSSSQNTVTITIPDNVFEITFNTQGHKVILNNTASYDLVLLSPYEISNTIGIFRTPGSSSTNSNGIGKVYSFVITDNLTNYILFNGIPVRRDSDGVVGMYDLADSNPATAFHTNAGTGTFVAGPAVPIKIATTRYNEEQFEPVQNRLSAAVNAVEDVVAQTMSQAQAIDQIANNKQTRPDEGCTAKYCLLVEDEQGVPHWYPIAGANGVAHNLPAGYTELQYIESTGTQYIDTGLKGTQNSKVVLDFQLSGYNDNGYILGSRTSQNTNAFLIGSNDGRFSNSGASFPFAHFDSVNPTMVQQEPNFDLNRHIYELSSGGFYIDGILYRTYSNPTNFSTPENITLFGRYSAGNFAYGIFRAYGLKLYNGNNLVRDLIPARNSSDEVGMYDMVSGQFFTNDGTGDFTAGPDM